MSSLPFDGGVAPSQSPSTDGAGSDALLDRFEALHPKTIDLSLGRVETLLARLGSPQDALPPVIHVAGTNGKGSTIAFLQSILEAAGHRIHCFTSPHLVRFHERIALAGPDGAEPIAEDGLADILTRAETANAGDPITFFEITTAAAMLAFAEAPADFLLLETGLGGRLDATNVVASPALTIITPISIDHTQFLGDTIEKIAFEKAGILKSGTTCVVAPQDPAAMAVIEARAEEVGAPLYASGREWDAFEQQGRLIYQTESGLLDLPLPRLTGRHQIANAGTAIAASQQIFSGRLPSTALETGLTEASWPGRLQRIVTGPLHRDVVPGTEIWLDGGHNLAAAETLARTMAELEERAPRPLHLITGMMSNKDAAGFFRAFQGLASWIGTVAIPGEKNAWEALALADEARAIGLTAESAASVEAALALSRSRSGAEPVRVLICGSLYLAGHVLGQTA